MQGTKHTLHLYFPNTKPLNKRKVFGMIAIRLRVKMHADWPKVCAVVEAGRGRRSRVKVCVSCPLAVGMLPHAGAIIQINAMETPHSAVSEKHRNKST